MSSLSPEDRGRMQMAVGVTIGLILAIALLGIFGV